MGGSKGPCMAISSNRWQSVATTSWRRSGEINGDYLVGETWTPQTSQGRSGEINGDYLRGEDVRHPKRVLQLEETVGRLGFARQQRRHALHVRQV